LHFIVLIFGFTAILGELISIAALPLVWYRMGIASILLFALLAILKRNPPNRKNIWLLLGTGGIIAAHWVTFFHAVKVSNVSVTLACMSTAPFFASILEPLFFKRKIKSIEVVLGIVTIIGLVLIFRVSGEYIEGIVFGLTSAFLAALFAVINGVFITASKPIWITAIEMLGGFLVLTIVLTASAGWNTQMFQLPAMDWVWIGVLATICTAYAFVVSVSVMKQLNPFTVVLSINMEPIYGIILAFLIFGESEKMTGSFYLGAAIIISTVFINAFVQAKNRRAEKKVSSTQN
jgi:drug/metabolite transporter (DMT)-like permease